MFPDRSLFFGRKYMR